MGHTLDAHWRAAVALIGEMVHDICPFQKSAQFGNGCRAVAGIAFSTAWPISTPDDLDPG
jgi:hypothetical protein